MKKINKLTYCADENEWYISDQDKIKKGDLVEVQQEDGGIILFIISYNSHSSTWHLSDTDNNLGSGANLTTNMRVKRPNKNYDYILLFVKKILSLLQKSEFEKEDFYKYSSILYQLCDLDERYQNIFSVDDMNRYNEIVEKNLTSKKIKDLIDDFECILSNLKAR